MQQERDKSTDVMCVIIPIKTLREDAQRRMLSATDCPKTLVGKRDGWRDRLLRAIRPGTLVKVARLHLLADRAALRGKGGMFAGLIRYIDQIEAAGGQILEVETGHLSSRSRDKNAMLIRASEHLRNASRPRTGLPPGRRPIIEKFEAHRAVIEAEWLSRRHRTNTEAVAAMTARGVVITELQAYKCMQQWTGKGASGRRPLQRK